MQVQDIPRMKDLPQIFLMQQYVQRIDNAKARRAEEEGQGDEDDELEDYDDNQEDLYLLH